jgi:hypothetical protein
VICNRSSIRNHSTSSEDGELIDYGVSEKSKYFHCSINGAKECETIADEFVVLRAKRRRRQVTSDEIDADANTNLDLKMQSS